MEEGRQSSCEVSLEDDGPLQDNVFKAPVDEKGVRAGGLLQGRDREQ